VKIIVVPNSPAMMRLKTAEVVVAPLESDDGSGTRSWTARARPDRLATVPKVLCSKTATGRLAALATSRTGRGTGWKAP
jgi:hypothetical protein